jgi:hypothetical protein
MTLPYIHRSLAERREIARMHAADSSKGGVCVVMAHSFVRSD